MLTCYIYCGNLKLTSEKNNCLGEKNMAKNSNITNKAKDIITNFSAWYYGLTPDMQQRVSDRLEGMLFTMDLKMKKEKNNVEKNSTNV